MAGKLEQAQRDLHGVIAAIATAVDESGEPDCARSIALAGFLLANGCDGLNVLGTTGEATSFSLDQRRRLMNAYAQSGLPLTRMMVGTGAAALADAIALTRHGAELGFAGALVLPPFYYKGVPDDGLLAVIDANYSTASPWCRGLRRSSPISMTTSAGHACSHPCPLTRSLTVPLQLRAMTGYARNASPEPRRGIAGRGAASPPGVPQRAPGRRR
jgi:hypothetical protein